MEMNNFIVIPERSAKGLTNNDQCEHTVSGHVYLSFDTPVPVIASGVGCIGYAKITSITFTSNKTTVIEFTLKSVSAKSAEAAYIMWQNTRGGSSSDDDANSQYIPGVYRSRTANVDSSAKQKKRPGGLPSFLDD